MYISTVLPWIQIKQVSNVAEEKSYFLHVSIAKFPHASENFPYLSEDVETLHTK